jgi:preprotein translocase subunit SecD
MMPSRASDLYFILNPSLGIIKIGVSLDVRTRRSELEHACGVPLTVLKIVDQAEEMEEPLHFAFLPSRLIGEWFAPTEELLSLIEGNETVTAFIERKSADIAEHRRAWDENVSRRLAMQQAAAQIERDEAKRIREEEKRLKAEREAKAVAAKLRRQAARDAEDETIRAMFAAQRDSTSGLAREMFSRLHDKKANEIADQRRATTEQRFRNAVMLGVIPYETQRGATVNASQIPQPSIEGHTT